MLVTIREVFVKNLREFRAGRTQAQIAELAGIPLRSYQRAEYGDIPQEDNLKAIARAFGVTPTRLFLDPALIAPSMETALGMVGSMVALLSKFTPAQRALFDILSTIDDEQAERFVRLAGVGAETRKETAALKSGISKGRETG